MVKNMNPTLSVITPTYNCFQYISRSYKNLCAQTFTDWEWVIVNDGSTDATKELINNISANDKRVKVYHFDVNKGRGAGREFAINKSNSDCIVIWDVDDLYHPSRLELVYNSLILKGLDFFCSYALVVTNDFEIKGGRHFYHNSEQAPSFVHPTLAFNKSKINLDYFYDITMKAGEDFRLMMILDKDYKGEYCEKYLMLYFEDREVNISKTLLVYKSHLRSYKSYLKGIEYSFISVFFRLTKMRIKMLMLKALSPFPKIYLKTVKYRNKSLVDMKLLNEPLVSLALEYKK
tara:strand:- start:14198 stop:15067 length:870 start_codon:yes stop_codon:yes gene_type:complete